jgi:hypothetical protein
MDDKKEIENIKKKNEDEKNCKKTDGRYKGIRNTMKKDEII